MKLKGLATEKQIACIEKWESQHENDTEIVDGLTKQEASDIISDYIEARIEYAETQNKLIMSEYGMECPNGMWDSQDEDWDYGEDDDYR